MKILNPILRWSKRHGLYHGWPIVFYLLSYLVWFHTLEAVPRKHYTVVILKLDEWIPFCEVFIIPYMSWFLFIALGIIFSYFESRDTYDELCTYLMFGMTAFLVISTFMPNRQPLRLLEMPRDNVFTRIVARLWMMDTPTNVWPSIHVFNSAAVVIAVLRSKGPHFRKPAVRLVTFIWGLLIALSTVFIKQHSIWDVMTASALILICVIFVSWRGYVLRFEDWDAFALRLEARVDVDQGKKDRNKDKKK